jgi:hypothetical protein
MTKQTTTDHGVILHWAGAHQRFPVSKKGEPAKIRLAAHNGVASDEERIGWPAFFGPFTKAGMVFLYDETDGQPASAASASSSPPPGSTSGPA